VDMHISKKGNQ